MKLKILPTYFKIMFAFLLFYSCTSEKRLNLTNETGVTLSNLVISDGKGGAVLTNVTLLNGDGIYGLKFNLTSTAFFGEPIYSYFSLYLDYYSFSDLRNSSQEKTSQDVWEIKITQPTYHARMYEIGFKQ